MRAPRHTGQSDCSCDDCWEQRRLPALRQREQGWYEHRSAAVENRIRHGGPSRYEAGCRCEACLEWWEGRKARLRERRLERRQAGENPAPLSPAALENKRRYNKAYAHKPGVRERRYELYVKRMSDPEYREQRRLKQREYRAKRRAEDGDTGGVHDSDA